MKDKLKKIVELTLDNFNKFQNEFKKNPKQFDKIRKHYQNLKQSKKHLIDNDKRIIVKKTKTIEIFDSIGDDLESWILAISYIHTIIVKFKEYNDLVNEINELHPEGMSWGFFFTISAEKPGVMILDGFLMNIIYKKLTNSLDENLIEQYIETFVDETCEKSIEITHFNSIWGIELNCNEIMLSNEITLKKGQETDYTSLENFIYFRKKVYVDLPPILLKVTKKLANIGEFIDLEQKAFTFLKLYKFSNVFHYDQYRYVKTVTGQGRLEQIKTNTPVLRITPYKIKKDEKDKVVELYSILDKKFNLILTNRKFRSLIVAIERYNWSLMGDYNIDRRLLFSIMGLEALFQKDDVERFNQQTNLCLRIPKLFKYLGLNPSNVNRKIAKAYSFRNHIAHGGFYEDEEKEKKVKQEIDNIFPHILNYLRICLLYFLYSLPETKNTIISIIDDSFLIDSRDKLLKGNIEKFKLVFENSIDDNIKNKIIPIHDMRIQFKAN